MTCFPECKHVAGLPTARQQVLLAKVLLANLFSNVDESLLPARLEYLRERSDRESSNHETEEDARVDTYTRTPARQLPR